MSKKLEQGETAMGFSKFGPGRYEFEFRVEWCSSSISEGWRWMKRNWPIFSQGRGTPRETVCTSDRGADSREGGGGGFPPWRTHRPQHYQWRHHQTGGGGKRVLCRKKGVTCMLTSLPGSARSFRQVENPEDAWEWTFFTWLGKIATSLFVTTSAIRRQPSHVGWLLLVVHTFYKSCYGKELSISGMEICKYEKTECAAFERNVEDVNFCKSLHR